MLLRTASDFVFWVCSSRFCPTIAASAGLDRSLPSILLATAMWGFIPSRLRYGSSMIVLGSCLISATSGSGCLISATLSAGSSNRPICPLGVVGRAPSGPTFLCSALILLARSFCSGSNLFLASNMASLSSLS